MAILDAPLTDMLSPFIGDAIVSSILGYNHESWAVRNSATMVFSAVMLRTIDPDKNASNKDKTSSNAITINELFRRYPRLPGFLEAVMKSPSSLEGERSRTFPILLLLSRVHPIVGSGSAGATQVEAFVPEILKCLSDKDFYVRAAAARALANLCSGKHISVASSASLLSWSSEILKNFYTSKDYNTLNGACLLLKWLLDSPASCQHDLFEMNLHGIIFHILDSGAMCLPPLCVESLTEVLSKLTRGIEASAFGDHVREVISGSLMKLTGNMATTASSAILSIASHQCHLLSAVIWHFERNDDIEISQKYLSELLELLAHSCIDVRLGASKTFKKGIYSGIDGAVKSKGAGGTLLISNVARILFNALEAEIARGATKGCSEWSHPPFLRRISRCLLECFDATKNISGGLSEGFFESSRIETVSKAMYNCDRAFLDNSFDPNGETVLTANAVELFAYAIALSASPVSLATVTEFSDQIARLNNEGLSWRCRYNAAVSIETSKLLEAYPGINDNTRNALLAEIRKMMMDNDPDVRAVACRVLCPYASLDAAHVPEFIIERAFAKTFSSSETDITLSELLQSILTVAPILELAISALEEEMKQDILNTASNRKIFEAESLNPKKDPALICQLCVKTLLESGTSSTLAVSEDAEQILFFASSALDACLSQRIHGKVNLMVDLTRYPSIFVPLHSILLASAAVLSLGTPDKRDTASKAQRLLVAHGSGDTTLVPHPEITKVLQVLASGYSEADAKLSIRDCCSLLPATL